MNNEIKEILENIKRQNEWDGIEYFKTPLSTKDANKLLDYITNLQEENERLEEIIKDNTILVKDNNGDYQECNINPLDYKSRCEKGIEYIKGWQSFPHTNGSTHNELRNLLNILQNGSDEK